MNSVYCSLVHLRPDVDPAPVSAQGRFSPQTQGRINRKICGAYTHRIKMKGQMNLTRCKNYTNVKNLCIQLLYTQVFHVRSFYNVCQKINR